MQRSRRKSSYLQQKFRKSKDIYHNYTFNRLSIIDLSKNASQPMQSNEFNSLIMFNGEIYNHGVKAFLEQKE